MVADVLCVDKTGTLTMNSLAVSRVVPLADGVTEAALLARAAAASSADGQDPVDAAIRAAAVERGEPPLSVIRFTPSIHARDIWTPMVSNYLQQLGNVEAQPS